MFEMPTVYGSVMTVTDVMDFLKKKGWDKKKSVNPTSFWLSIDSNTFSSFPLKVYKKSITSITSLSHSGFSHHKSITVHHKSITVHHSPSSQSIITTKAIDKYLLIHFWTTVPVV